MTNVCLLTVRDHMGAFDGIVDRITSQCAPVHASSAHHANWRLLYQTNFYFRRNTIRQDNLLSVIWTLYICTLPSVKAIKQHLGPRLRMYREILLDVGEATDRLVVSLLVKHLLVQSNILVQEMELRQGKLIPLLVIEERHSFLFKIKLNIMYCIIQCIVDFISLEMTKIVIKKTKKLRQLTSQMRLDRIPTHLLSTSCSDKIFW